MSAGSLGTAFLLTVILASPRAASASLPGIVLADQVHQHQVVIRAAGYDLDAAFDKGRRHCPVGDHLLLVTHKFRARRFLEAHRLGGDDVHQRAALAAGKTAELNFFSSSLVGARQDKAAAGTAQGLVGR